MKIKVCDRCGNSFRQTDNEKYCPTCAELKRREFKAKFTASQTADLKQTEQPIQDPNPNEQGQEGLTLKQARVKAIHSINSVADALMIPKSSYLNYERGNYMPADLLTKFAEIVNIPKEKIKYRLPKKARPFHINKTPAKPQKQTLDITRDDVKLAVNNLVASVNKAYPQDAENNEYRYINAKWLDEVATGLTAEIKKHPGETWRNISVNEHLARALRHINLMRMGDQSDSHIINASMRLMMAYVVDRLQVPNKTDNKK